MMCPLIGLDSAASKRRVGPNDTTRTGNPGNRRRDSERIPQAPFQEHDKPPSGGLSFCGCRFRQRDAENGNTMPRHCRF